MFLAANYPGTAVTLFVTAVIIGIVYYSVSSSKKAKMENIQRESEDRAKLAYKDFRSKVVIPSDAAIVTYKGGYANILEGDSYLWIDDNALRLFPTKPPELDTPSKISKIAMFEIPVDKIEYFATRGDVIHENKISGGGGGGSSVGGAIIGGVIAGGAGAVVGSRKSINPIKSELITHDTRETFLNFYDDNNNKCSIVLEYQDYSILNELLPEKSHDIVNAIKTNSILSKAVEENKSANIADQIRELAKLRDDGILTDEEFAEKKKLLLDKIS